MRIVKVGPNEFWTVPEAFNVMDHVKPGARIMWLEKLPPNAVKIGDVGEIGQYAIDRNARNVEYQAKYRKKMRAAGYQQVTVWVLPINIDRLNAYVRRLKK